MRAKGQKMSSAAARKAMPTRNPMGTTMYLKAGSSRTECTEENSKWL